MPKEQKKYCVIAFRSSREPLDDMLFAEAVYDGSWTEIGRLETVKYRRDLLEELASYGSALIAIDAPLGFPKPFIDHLGDEAGGGSWRSLAKIIREDLKKNTEDGIKRWAERMGRYRESDLETEEERRQALRLPINRTGRRYPEPPKPYELRSKAERFRRIEHIAKRLINKPIESTLGIIYNKLVSRYDFLESEAQGRRALMAIAFLEQFREQNESIAVWPFDEPGAVTIAEILHPLFPSIDPKEADKKFDAMEDTALHITDDVRSLVKRSPEALKVLTTLLGILGAERREHKAIRPLRDYQANFYADPIVALEGWIYGIGYKQPSSKDKQQSAADVSSEQR